MAECVHQYRQLRVILHALMITPGLSKRVAAEIALQINIQSFGLSVTFGVSYPALHHAGYAWHAEYSAALTHEQETLRIDATGRVLLEPGLDIVDDLAVQRYAAYFLSLGLTDPKRVAGVQVLDSTVEMRPSIPLRVAM